MSTATPASHDPGHPQSRPESASSPDRGSANPHVQGVCQHFMALDVGFSINLNQAERYITAQRERIRHKRRAPQYFEYDPHPLRVVLDSEPLTVGQHRTTANVEAMIFDFGAVSLTFTIPFAGPLADLQQLSDLLYDNESIQAEARRCVKGLLDAIAPAVTKPRILDIVEDYSFYLVQQVEPAMPSGELLSACRHLLARILRAETCVLSEQEVGDALACRLSFGEQDCCIIDWNAAMVFDTDADDVGAVLEYANVELLEMRYLDDQLDDALDEAYQALNRPKGAWRSLFSSKTATLRRIGELQVDAALLFEGVNNALKLLGDQYLARVYRAAAQRLHVNDWDASIIRKLQTLESIYDKIANVQSNLRMELLEWIIIILIALSILITLPGIHK